MDWTLESMAAQSGKRILITGANSGIGLEAAKALANKGAEVILACRNPEKAEQAVKHIQHSNPNGCVSHMTLDLASLASIKTFASAFEAQYDSLDILINNAGVMVPPYTKTEDGFELQFGTNHLGHFALTGQLLPLMEAAPAARIVVVSSLAHRFGRINFKNLNGEKYYFRGTAYGQSKLANLIFAQELQRRLEKQGATTIAVAAHPGISSTELSRYLPGGRLKRMVGQSQAAGALPTLYAATAQAVTGGDYIGPDGFLEVAGHPKKAHVAAKAKDRKTAAQLWSVSENMTGTAYLTA